MRRYATTIIDPAVREDRGDLVHRTISRLREEVGGGEVAVESFYDPAAGGWRVTAYNLDAPAVAAPGEASEIPDGARWPGDVPAPEGGVDSLDAMVESTGRPGPRELDADVRPDSYGYLEGGRRGGKASGGVLPPYPGGITAVSRRARRAGF